MKKIIPVLTVLAVVILSIIGGLGYSKYASEKKKEVYPRKYEALVSKAAENGGIPENDLYALAKVRSGFSSDYTGKNGERGLFALDVDVWSDYSSRSGDPDDARLLYDPELSIKAAADLLSRLYEKYLTRDAVMAAFYDGEAAVDAAIAENSSFSVSSCSRGAQKFIEEINNTVKIYESLYPQEKSDK